MASSKGSQCSLKKIFQKLLPYNDGHDVDKTTSTDQKNQSIVIPMPDNDCIAFPKEWRKTALALLYAVCCLILTGITTVLVHEIARPKEEEPPLPDIILNNFERIPWAFYVTEIILILLMAIMAIHWVGLRHRSIVIRRYLCILGTLFLYRCVTISVTILAVPGMHFNCAPKLHGDYKAMFMRMLKMLSGGGLSMAGAHKLCGDYLYSGHTVLLVLPYLFIKEYSPPKLWLYTLICKLLCAVGVIGILLAHEHYTIDVLVAYFITSRCFYWYHTIANHQVLKEPSTTNLLSGTWWFRPFLFFERNVHGVVPCSYQWPFPKIKLPTWKAKDSQTISNV